MTSYAQGTEEPTMPDRAEFAAATAGYRRELLAYCYRFLGSIDEAEDVVQEIYLRAWRSYATFEHRSSVRTWLYRIATNACLTAFAQNARRPLPSGMAGSSSDINVPGIPDGTDIGWLQPFPTASTRPGPSDPAWVIESRGSLRLAFIAALQLLPPRQRAVLILRDVLAWRAAEVADLLGISPVAVKSILQRARAQLARTAPDEAEITEPAEPRLRRLLEAYVSALENADITTLVQLLRADARFEMPPFSTWFEGRDAVARFIGSRVLDRPGTLRLMPTQANGQPAVAAYRRGVDGVHRAHAIHVLTIDNTSIIRIVAFLDADLFSRFDLPREYPTAAQN
ncbi:sigma-70 family RNA polymerase sigma factor [Actinomadura madurae]|uniref:sigma-70 family RNA polymerase sigma factor n=1 Tax=Actinomadura madurae TaxID=1993 RepID=UPI0020D256BF|nr:sigma-70 family RNA polymerase sigma factor [Actinomadura madurae]MCP9967800.1 sigma-70 family RNA polymerase sigma factor [Actinomadura madurae]MCP9980254.1 sigma-70 family RNA polymerase sigma factor [Actinomadura madurae]